MLVWFNSLFFLLFVSFFFCDGRGGVSVSSCIFMGINIFIFIQRGGSLPNIHNVHITNDNIKLYKSSSPFSFFSSREKKRKKI